MVTYTVYKTKKKVIYELVRICQLLIVPSAEKVLF